MSDNETKEERKEETKEERKAHLKEKLRSKINQKKLGRMNKNQKKEEVNKYCNQLGITSEQLEQFQSLGKQLEKLKNNVPYR